MESVKTSDNIFYISGSDGYETYPIDNNHIGIRPKWISVLDIKNLPESLEDVLFTDGKEVFKGFRIESFDKEYNDWHSVTEFVIQKVTHWMPLPKPPRLDD